jgi:hypothetical protein
MESITYNRADISFDGATYSNLWSIMKSGVAVETFVKGEGIKIRQTSSNTLYIYDEETRVYITYPNPALLPTDLSTINGWVGSTGGGGGAVTIADGADVALGATTNSVAPTDTANASLISLFKRLLQRISTLISWVTRNTVEVETQVNIATTAPTPTLPFNPNRKSIKIFNPPGAPAIRVSYNTPVSTGSLRIAAGGANGVLYEFPQPVPMNDIYIVTISGTSTITIIEG